MYALFCRIEMSNKQNQSNIFILQKKVAKREVSFELQKPKNYNSTNSSAEFDLNKQMTSQHWSSLSILPKLASNIKEQGGEEKKPDED